MKPLADVIIRYPQSPDEDLAQFCERVKKALDTDAHAIAAVDVTGAGAAVLDRLREMGCRALPVQLRNLGGDLDPPRP